MLSLPKRLQEHPKLQNHLAIVTVVVTVDGDIVNAGGSLTGGGVKGQASVFTRKAELETLKEQIARMAASIESATTNNGRYENGSRETVMQEYRAISLTRRKAAN